jgi:hypothetical protein
MSSHPESQESKRAKALRILSALRQGSNCLEDVELFSVGRHSLLNAALEVLEELEITNGSVVRWIKGRYGHGKTHLFARLMAMAYQRNWITSYVQISLPGQGVEFARFNDVYSAIVRNCLCREMIEEDEGRVNPGRTPGWEWILDKWFDGLRSQAGARRGEVSFLVMQDVINQTVTAIQRKWAIYGSFAEALRQYARARAEQDEQWLTILLQWFRGEDVHARGGEVRKRLRDAGISESLNKRNAKEMLRCLSAFIKYRNFGGLLIMLDEVENVLHSTPVARRTAYTTLRELIDNVDDRHGMMSTCFYAAGTPDLFESAKGFSEYEALAERVLLAAGSNSNPLAPLVDLTQFPLTRTDYAELSLRMIDLYEVAKKTQVPGTMKNVLAELLNSSVAGNPDLSPRAWVRLVADKLDGALTH